MKPTHLRFAFLLLALVVLPLGGHTLGAAELYARNTEVPFCYLAGGERSWQITDEALRDGDKFLHEIEGESGAGNVQIRLQQSGHLTVISDKADSSNSLRLKVTLRKADGSENSQTLRLHPAPPDRPISYLSDLMDDLLRIFWDNEDHQWRPITHDAFDQYFRRLQAHGVRRLIVWQSAFPIINDPANYAPEDWQRFEKQARAMVEDTELQDILYGRKHRPSYQWHEFLMRFRLNPEWGQMYARSAADHGIALSASYRPFEHALMKYYVIPTFDHDGNFLWNFLPSASPTVNFRSDEVSFAHYRKILQAFDKSDHATLESVTFAAVSESQTQALTPENLRIFAGRVPPVAKRSFVLVRDAKGEFDLRRYESIAAKAESRRIELTGWSLDVDDSGNLRISGLKRPPDARYLFFKTGTEPAAPLLLPVELPVVARSKAGSRLGRINAYWALDEDSADADAEADTTRIGGITAGGSARSDFQAIENSFRLVRKSGEPLRPLGSDEIVIDFGADWSPEMMDFQRTAARRAAVNEIRTMLAAPAFDEIFINTRSHTQLAGSNGDGELGVQTIGHHRNHKKNYSHLGIDRAYGPLAIAKSATIKKLVEPGQASGIEKITEWQAGEWQGTCQASTNEFPWRYGRNVAIANGVRQLLVDLENEFPDTRIRVVIPPRTAVEDQVVERLENLPNPNGGNYAARYYSYLRTGLNHIPAIGEGISMVDLSGLRSEPVLLGFRHLPDPAPAALHLDAYLSDQADQHGSSFRGPKSFFYEAQQTLRETDKEAATKRRQEIVRDVLARDEIDEVILYESADWTYYLPLLDPHRHLENN